MFFWEGKWKKYFCEYKKGNEGGGGCGGRYGGKDDDGDE